MNLRVLATEEEMARGVIGLPALGAEEVFFFASLGGDELFHMNGVPFALDIAFLDRSFRIIEIARMAAQTGLAWVPPGCAYAAETRVDYFRERGLRAGARWLELRDALRAAGSAAKGPA